MATASDVEGSITESPVLAQGDVVEALRESEERLRYALDATNEGLWDADLTLGRMYVNDRWLLQLGYAPGETRPAIEVWQAALHPEDAPRIVQLLAEFLQSNRDEHHTEHRIVTRAGEVRWQRSAGKVVARDAQGRPLRMVGTNTDITARKQAEEHLREREAALELSQALAHVGHWVWDTQDGRSGPTK
jgi:PAS domain S-box-containing protein